MELGGLHPITGRQWQLSDERTNAIWPDACLVVPFGAQVKDATGKIVNPASGTSNQGGWTVVSTLEKLQLTDLVQNVTVAGVTAVWAAGPGGDTPALHVLGDNPFAWLTPHLDAAASASTTVYPPRDQWFGPGPAELFSASRRFGEIVIAPAGGQPARMLTAPISWLNMRMLQAPGARLSFSYPSGLPIIIDQLWLGVLLRGREELHATGWQLDQIIVLSDGWTYALLRLDVGADADAIDIPYGGSILFVRYRHRPLSATAPERITLRPGHYELTLSGRTTGNAPPGFDDAAEVPWSATQRFWVDHPPSLRPYVHSSTIGDDRLFGTRGGFDPTLPGVGFPAHRDYLQVVRFCVPYVSGMFQTLRLRLAYPDAPGITQDVAVVPNAAGESTLPQAATDWTTAHGGTVQPDDEVVMSAALTPGAGSLHISHLPAAGPEFELDSWGVHVSRFANAASHLAWPGTCLTRYYRGDGPRDQAACRTLAEPPWGGSRWAAHHALLRTHDLHSFEPQLLEHPMLVSGTASSLAGKLLSPVQSLAPPPPDEYDSPPDDWPLPTLLASLIEPLGPSAARRFLLFLWRSGVRLSADAAAAALAGVGDPVGATTVEAVCDDQARPLALWCRTPEPLDWRRVHAAITLRHVEPDTGCPTRYANRYTMPLTVEVLPSPDGSGALLVGELGGTATRLPRGEITLTMRYEPQESGLVRLRPRTALPSGHETVLLTFLQPLGLTWPTRPPAGGGGVRVPHFREVLAPVPHVGPPAPGPLRELIQILQSGEARQ
jgi:hypothetical protein